MLEIACIFCFNWGCDPLMKSSLTRYLDRNVDTVPELKTLRTVILVWGVFVIYNNLRGCCLVAEGTSSSLALRFSCARWDTWSRTEACALKRRSLRSVTSWKLRSEFRP